MGMFSGSIHLKGSDASSVVAVLEKIHKVHGAKFMVEDAPGGWCSVFPNNSGQDSELAREIMKSFHHKSIYLVVHDSDILSIDIHDGESRFQTYNNRPDYFGEKLPPDQVRALTAFPENLSFFAAPGKMPKLQGLFSPLGEVVFVDDTLRSIAKILGVPQAAFSYETIEMGEYISQARLKKLVPVPAKGTDQAALAVVKEAIQTLKKSQWLLFEKKGGPHHGGFPFRWGKDPETGHVGITYHKTGLGEGKLVWSSGEVHLKPVEKRWDLQPFGDVGLHLAWDKDRRTHRVEDNEGRVVCELPPGLEARNAQFTPDQSLMVWGDERLVYWFDLKTHQEGRVDLSVLPETKLPVPQVPLPEAFKRAFDRPYPPRVTVGPGPYLTVSQGPHFLLWDWIQRQVAGYGRPQFPFYTQELLAEGLWRKESPELWEPTENFILRFKNNPDRVTQLRQFFDPASNYVFLGDGHFLAKFDMKGLLAGRGGPILAEWALFYTACPAGRFQEFGNSGGCRFPMLFDAVSGLWIFGDMMGVLRALDPATHRLYRLVEMPRRVEAFRFESEEGGKCFIALGLIHKELYKYDSALQVYDLRKLLDQKTEDGSGFKILKPNPPEG